MIYYDYISVFNRTFKSRIAGIREEFEVRNKKIIDMKEKLITFLIATFILFAFTEKITADTWDGTSVNTDWYSFHKDTLIISTAAELAGLAELVKNYSVFTEKTIELAADIDLNNKPWTPIGNQGMSFYGSTFDGKGHTISNMKVEIEMSGDEAFFAGLFGDLSQATVKDLNVEGDISLTTTGAGRVSAGGIAGYAQVSAIQNCSFSGTVASASSNMEVYSGGIVGTCNRSILHNNYSRAAVSIAVAYSHQSAGGIAGSTVGEETSVQNNYFEGSISLARESVTRGIGGITGDNGYLGAGVPAISNNYWQASGVNDAIGYVHNLTGPNIKDNEVFTSSDDLVTKLNAWVEDNQTSPASYLPWEIVAGKNDGYPIFVDGTHEPTYGLNFTIYGGGDISCDKSLYKEKDLVTLILEAYEGYMFGSISVDGGEVQLTEVTKGAEYTFTMPAKVVEVEVTFISSHPVEDQEAVEAAKEEIESVLSYRITQVIVGTEAELENWLLATLKILFGRSVAFRSSSDEMVTAVVNITKFIAPIAGTEENPTGIDGSFTFTVTLTKADAEVTTNEVKGVIVATPFVETKQLEMYKLGELRVRILNTGNVDIPKLIVTLTGEDAEHFTLSYETITDLAAGAEREIVLLPAEDLTEGIYAVMVTVTGEGISEYVNISYHSEKTGIPETIVGNATLWAVQTDAGLLIKGLIPGETFSIITMQGRVIYRGQAVTSEQAVAVKQRGVYIIVCGNRSAKILR